MSNDNHEYYFIDYTIVIHKIIKTLNYGSIDSESYLDKGSRCIFACLRHFRDTELHHTSGRHKCACAVAILHRTWHCIVPIRSSFPKLHQLKRIRDLLKHQSLIQCSKFRESSVYVRMISQFSCDIIKYRMRYIGDMDLALVCQVCL